MRTALSTNPTIDAQLNTLLNDAAKVLGRAAIAARNKAWSHHHEAALHKRIIVVSELLTRCCDGGWYGMVKPDAIVAMRAFIADSEVLVMKNARVTRPDVTDKELRTGPDTWAMSRALKINGRFFEHALVCHNPAYGKAKLNEWEQEVRDSLLLRAA
jgi:hypothetical protein